MDQLNKLLCMCFLSSHNMLLGTSSGIHVLLMFPRWLSDWAFNIGNMLPF